MGACIRPCVSFFALWAWYRLQFLQLSDTNLTCKFLITKEGTLFIFGHKVEGTSISNLALCLKNDVGKIQATVFAESLSKFTSKLLMMREGTLGNPYDHGLNVFWHILFQSVTYPSTCAIYEPLHGKTYDLFKIFDLSFFTPKFFSCFKWSSTEI